MLLFVPLFVPHNSIFKNQNGVLIPNIPSLYINIMRHIKAHSYKIQWSKSKIRKLREPACCCVPTFMRRTYRLSISAS